MYYKHKWSYHPAQLEAAIENLQEQYLRYEMQLASFESSVWFEDYGQATAIRDKIEDKQFKIDCKIDELKEHIARANQYLGADWNDSYLMIDLTHETHWRNNGYKV